MKGKNGEILEDPEQVHDWWKEHFSELLDTTFSQDESILEYLHAPPLLSALDDKTPPATEEASTPIKKLKNGKAPGVDGIPHEMIKAGGPVVVELLTKLFKLI